MVILIDTASFQRSGENAWVEPETGDRVRLEVLDRTLLPAKLDDLPRLRHAPPYGRPRRAA